MPLSVLVRLAPCLVAAPPRTCAPPIGAIVGEPSDMAPVLAAKAGPLRDLRKDRPRGGSGPAAVGHGHTYSAHPVSAAVGLAVLDLYEAGLLDNGRAMGARLLHAGRAASSTRPRLLAALDAGRLAAAMLDVADPEPLPPDHPLWRHARAIVTPHVACQARAEDAAAHVIAGIRADLAGQAPSGLVDRGRGY